MIYSQNMLSYRPGATAQQIKIWGAVAPGDNFFSNYVIGRKLDRLV